MPSLRPVVLVLTGHYLPGYKAGGPIRTIRNLVSGLGDEFDFRVVTSDHDFGQREPYTGVTSNAWRDVDKAQVFYADVRGRRARRLAATINEASPDVVYVNSFFSPRFSIAPLTLRRMGLAASRAAWIVAPRGEFAPEALAIKPLKKRVYMTAARAFGLHRRVVWQASSEHEAADIQREAGVSRDKIVVARNLTAPVDIDLPLAAKPIDPSRLSVCFLARVCAMKNLAFAIETLARCSCRVALHVYGPVEDEAYAEKCRGLVPSTGSLLTVTWHGEVPHEQVRSVLASHDVFFLPTLGENFGHGIFESLAAGVPVLLSDRTPWRDLGTDGVGWVLPLDEHKPFVDAIESLAALTPEDRLGMRRRAHAYAARAAATPEAREANRQLFYIAIERANRVR